MLIVAYKTSFLGLTNSLTINCCIEFTQINHICVHGACGPPKRQCFCNSFLAKADDIYKGLFSRFTSSYDGQWEIWYNFCGVEVLKPLLIFIKNLPPSAMPSPDRTTPGNRPERPRSSHHIVEDAVRLVGQALVAPGSRNSHPINQCELDICLRLQ